MNKSEVEEILKESITDELFEKALEYAKRKQEYIYNLEHRSMVLQHWYLVQLTKEYVIALSFSKFTMDLCETLCNMKKELQIIDHGTHQANHIVTANV